MKITVAIVLTAFLAYVTGIYSTLPWWSFAITSLLVALAVHQKPGKSFLSGFLGLFLLWAVLAFIKDSANEHVLSAKVAQLLLKNSSSIAIILLTGIVGGLVSGFAALTGSYLRK
jgi:FtsH-binding integral membrane protein